MMSLIDTAPGATAAGEVMRGQVSQAGFDGVLLRSDSYTSLMRMTLLVTLATPNGSEVLCNIPTLFGAERSDFKGGSSFGAAYEQALETTAEAEALAQVEAFIDLGHTELSGADVVDVKCSIDTALDAGGGVRMSYVDLGPGKETTKAIREGQPGVATFSFPEEVYIFRDVDDTYEDAVAEAAAGACVVNLKTGRRSYVFDAIDAWSFTRCIGQVESKALRRTACVFLDKAMRNPSGECSVTLTGTDKANWRIFGVEKLLLADRAVRKVAELATAQGNELRKVPADKLRALRAQAMA